MSSLPPTQTTPLQVLLDRLDCGDDPRRIKEELAAFALRFLDLHQQTLTYEQKLHFVNAVGTLSMKRGSGKRMTAADIRIAILDMNKAMSVTDDIPALTPRPLQEHINGMIDVDMLRYAVLASLQRTPADPSKDPQIHR